MISGSGYVKNIKITNTKSTSRVILNIFLQITALIESPQSVLTFTRCTMRKASLVDLSQQPELCLTYRFF